MRLRALSRRSFLFSVTGNAIAGGALGLVAGAAWAQPRSATARPPRRMVVDADPNDPARSGTTDSDAGARADRAGNGRGTLGSGSAAPSQPAPPSPPAQGRPRVRTGVTNRDPGDPPGYGRTGSTNSDPTDLPSYGRRGGGGPPGLPSPRPGPSPTQRIVICPGNRRCPR